MPMIGFFGALCFVVGVALLAFDAARSLKIGQFETTSLERMWTNLGGDSIVQLSYVFHDWFGVMADQLLELPAAFVVFGLGMAILILRESTRREHREKFDPLLSGPSR